MRISCEKWNPDKNSYLIDAISENNLAEVVTLIADGVEVNPQSTLWLDSPLQVAIFKGHKEILETLISKGARVDMRDSDGYFPIHKAVKRNQKEIVEILLKNGADVDAKCSMRTPPTPISYAIQEANIEIVDTLLQYGAKIDQPDKYGNTPILEAVYTSQKEILEIFLKTYPDLTKPCFNSILHFAVYNNNMPDIAEMLLDYGVEIDAYDGGVTPIHIAVEFCENNPLEHTKMLLRKGASLKIKYVDGNTPLECALKKDAGRKLDFIKVITYHQHY